MTHKLHNLLERTEAYSIKLAARLREEIRRSEAIEYNRGKQFERDCKGVPEEA